MVLKGKSRTAAALRAALASYVTRFITLLLGFVVTPIVLAQIGRETYGYWVIVGSVIGYVGMVDFGITGSVATLIAREQHHPEAVSRTVSNALVALTAARVLAVIGSAIAVVVAPGLLRLTPASAPMVCKLILLAGTGLALSFPVRALKAALRGVQRIATLRLTEFGLALFRIALMLALLYLGNGVYSLPWSTIAASILGFLVLWPLAGKSVPGFKPSLALVSRREIREILGVSAWWFLGSLGALFIYQTDNIVVGRYIGATAVTVYALTFRIPNMVRGQLYQLNLSLAPGIGNLVGTGRNEQLRALYPQLLRITLFLGITAAALVFKLNRSLVSLWVGPENYGGDLLTLIFSVGVVYLLVFHLSSVILTNYLDLKVLAGTRFVEGIVNLVLSLVLVGRFGMLGVAAATLAAGFLTTAWFLPSRASRLVGLPLGELLGQVLPRGSLFLIVAVVVVLVTPESPQPSWLRAGVTACWVSFVLVVAGWFILLPRQVVLKRLQAGLR